MKRFIRERQHSLQYWQLVCSLEFLREDAAFFKMVGLWLGVSFF